MYVCTVCIQHGFPFSKRIRIEILKWCEIAFLIISKQYNYNSSYYSKKNYDI